MGTTAQDYVASLKDEIAEIVNCIPLHRLENHGLLRTDEKYFLNIAYPSLQAMGRIEPSEVLQKYAWLTPSAPICLYIHIPFCSGICRYCHYYKLVGHHEQIPPYLQAIGSELRLYKEASSGLLTRAIYVGGGTPSVLSAKQIASLFSNIRDATTVADDAEISFEVHPEHASRELFTALKDAGVNRINIGVESFDDRILTDENRRHSAADAIRAVEEALNFFQNVNIDLIYGMRYQTLDGWISTLIQATKLQPASVCAYYLRLRETTPLFKIAKSNPKDFPSSSEKLMMHIATLSHMAKTGYSQDIVDWFFREPRFFHSYQMYNWLLTDSIPLLGVGASAYSYVAGAQYYNVNDLNEYCRRLEASILPVERGELLRSEDERMRRALMLGLKFSIRRLELTEQFGLDVVDAFPNEFDLLTDLGFVDIDEDTIRLTNIGTLFADEVGQLFYSDAIRRRMDNVRREAVSTTYPKFNPFVSRFAEKK